jgi:hypothetical protein
VLVHNAGLAGGHDADAALRSTLSQAMELRRRMSALVNPQQL